jgi:hypothetical protein
MPHTRRRGWGLPLMGVAPLPRVPVTQGAPPVVSDIPTAPAVQAVSRCAGADCPSRQAGCPSYACGAPVSWRLAHKVREDRDALHGTAWSAYTAEQQTTQHKESWETIVAGAILHGPRHQTRRSAALSD